MNQFAPALDAVESPADALLVTRVLDGEISAFELLMRRHNQRLYRIARAVVRNDAEAEEIVQEAYVRAFENLAGFRGRSSVATWLSRITLHQALRSKRRARRDHPMECRGMEYPDRLDRGDAPSDPMEGDETRSVVTAALDSLPTRLRAVVMLRLVEGLSTRETAESLGMTEANTKVILHRARQMMSESIQRETVSELRGKFSFAAERCDRIVAGVFARLNLP